METGVLVAVAEPFVIGSTSFVTHLVEDGIHHLVVERRSHTDRFGINGHVAHVGNAVQSLAPPVELLDTQARNGIRHVKHQRRLLFQRQAAQQVLCTLTGRQFGILIWQHFLSRSTGTEHRHRHYNRYSLFHNGYYLLSNVLPNIGVFRSLRVLRLLRVLRSFRPLRVLRSLTPSSTSPASSARPLSRHGRQSTGHARPQSCSSPS